MTKSETSTDKALPKEAERALVRSRLYKLFSVALASPEAGWIVALKDNFFVQALRGELQALAVDLAPFEVGLSQLLNLVAGEALIQEYTDLFIHPASCALPYQTEYTASHAFMKGNEISDLLGFYHAFGLDLSPEQRERADFIVTELEFMHVLCLKEATARLHHFGHIDVTVDAERTFLKDHLGRWIPAFLYQVESGRPDSIYRTLLELLAAFLRVECEAFHVVPEPLSNLTGHSGEEEAMSCATGCPLA